jgi:multidrug efflux pump subunit AcrB
LSGLGLPPPARFRRCWAITEPAEITQPIEIALREVPGVTRIRSTTSRGAADVGVNFAWGDDMVAATLATQGALATILLDLPPGTRFSVRRSDPTIFPCSASH